MSIGVRRCHAVVTGSRIAKPSARRHARDQRLTSAGPSWPSRGYEDSADRNGCASGANTEPWGEAVLNDGWGSEARSTWDRIHQEETPWLSHYLRRLLPADAIPDVLQEIWLTFWTARDRYQESGRRRAFLRRLADRRAADWHRVTRAGLDLTLPDPVPPDPDFTGQLLRTHGVNPGSLLWRRIVDDWSLPDLAAHFDVPVGTIKSRLAHHRRDLRRRLDTWYEAGRNGHEPCWHFRAEVLGATPCPLCLRERRTWQTIVARSRLHAFFQASYFTLESDHSLWLDWTVHVSRPLGRDPLMMYSQVDLGPLRRLRTRHGHDLRPRVRKSRVSDQEWWTWGFQDADGPLLAMSQRSEPEGAERIGLLQRRRYTVEVHLDVPYGDEADGAMVLELPRTLTVVSADPVPWRVTALHGHPVLMWTRCATLPHYPIVTAH
jgi:DNA-directed RNA polymerase specialized sigma24 family protein